MKLVLLQSGKAIPYPIPEGQTVIGRHPDCGVQLESNMVSRQHARVDRNGDNVQIEDLQSGNGVFVNGKRIETATPWVLTHGDRVKIGPTLFRFEDQEALSAGSTIKFNVDMTDDSDVSSTIMGSSAAGGYGLLDVRPEAKLKAVLEISRSLAGTVDLEKLLPRILDTLFEIFPQADRGCILLKDEESGQLRPAAQKHRREEDDATVKLSRTILKKVIDEKAGILSADAANDSRFDASESISSLTIRSMMCVPMLDLAGEPAGVINIDTQNPVNRFNESDLDLLNAIASQAALTYETARLMASFMQKQKQDSEMRIASDVQHALLPSAMPIIKGYEFFASYDAAQAVGGDYYDVIELPGNKVCVSFGDVAGKGVPGALIMSRMASAVQSTMAFTTDVSEAIQAINKHMCHSMVEGRFVTYLLIVIDLDTNEMILANAGHMSPIIRHVDGTIEEFDEETIGIPVGIMDDYQYELMSRRINVGETVVLITDGVDEAMDPDGKLYGKERVREFVRNNASQSEAMGRALLADVRKHANGRAQNDDITIMTFTRTENGKPDDES
jgi:sigma-B regulation protein RsbU (phosphoserine phosphatase)